MEVLDKGKHCQDEFCHQLDLLPMQCKACRKYFCSEHFKYESHHCKESEKLNYKIPTCQYCQQTIPFTRGKNLDLCLAEHMQRCYLNGYNKKPAKTSSNSKKCNYSNCKSSEIFRFECQSCSLVFCNKHRIPEVHNCNLVKCSTQYKNGIKEYNPKTYSVSSY